MTTLLRAVAFGIGAALAASCATTPPPSSGRSEGLLTLAPSQTSPVEGESLRVRFDGVQNDSRCPADAACIQAGEAVVGITVVAADGGRQSYELHTTGATSLVHAGVTIALEGLEPRPVSSRPIRPADYRLTLRARR